MVERGRGKAQALKAKITRFTVTVSTLLVMAVSPAAAQTNSTSPAPVNCRVDPSMKPLVQFLGEVIVFTKYMGVLVGTLGILTGALMIAGPFGRDIAQKGRTVVKSSILGLLILVSASMIVGFVTSNLPVCA